MRLESRFRSLLIGVVAVLTSASLVTGCSNAPEVTYDDAGADGQTLRIFVGGEGYRDVLEFVADEGLVAGLTLELVDAPDDADAELSTGTADLAFHQTQPAFLGTPESGASIVSKVDVVPYGIYSSKWRNLNETNDWVNAGIVPDSITGDSLPHGAAVIVPNTTAGYARGLYLLQSAGLVELDRPFGGLSVQDLSIDDANVLDSLRHLNITGLDLGDGLAKDVLRNYDAVVLDAVTATAIGLVPDSDALAAEPGPGNPYARVLVAPARLAGDARVSALVHALESRQVADYLAATYHGAYLPAFAVDDSLPTAAPR